ncbi:uncharacterized protein LOC143236172 [Tachypleus tridentatus]|uniref:uncharacterized protein LOC143236172 n=1 Tax=Tachypleus tridentatus TaxID=6853 RepID=UPI003FD181C5
MTYYLSISDFSKCPLNEENEFLVVRIWFPQVPGIVLMNDQDVAIKCKPPEHVITKQQTAGFAGNIPSVGRVSGIVEKNPGKLEYMLQLYKESTIKSGNFEIPIDGAVNIGTMLQLKAVINTKSVWKYAKLLEVTISSDPSDPYAIGHVALVTDGCRVKDFESLMPKQPERLENQPGEVTLEFEAFMLDNMPVSGQLWIHAQIKACIDPADCIAEFCLDLFQPSGHGKKKRSTFNETRYFLEFPRIPLHRNVPSKLTEDATSNSANIGENIGITIVVPGADKKPLDGNSVSGFNCTPFLALSGVLSCMFFFAAILAGSMARKVHCLLQERRVSSLENVFSGKATPSNGFMSTIEGQKSVNFSLPQRNDAFGYMSTSPTKSF